MDQLYAGFYGDFTAADGSEYIVKGTLTTFPEGAPRFFYPNIDLICALAEVIPKQLAGQVFTLQQTLFLSQVNSAWEIGTVDNNGFIPLNSEFYNEIKNIIMEGYNDKVNEFTQPDAPIPD